MKGDAYLSPTACRAARARQLDWLRREPDCMKYWAKNSSRCCLEIKGWNLRNL